MKRIMLTLLVFCCSFSAIGQTRMFIQKTGGTDSMSLTEIKSIYFKVILAGTKIVFTSNRDGNKEIYTIKADGTSLTRLTATRGDESYTRWSPDGTKIAYAYKDTSTTPAEIYTMNPDGSGKAKITDNLGWGHDNISWLAWVNNNEIVYNGTGGTTHWACWKVNITTLVHTEIYSISGAQRLATEVDTISGKLWGMAIVDYGHGVDDWVFSCNSDGTNFVRVVNNLGYNNAPTWPVRINPSGTKIVYPWSDRINPCPLWMASTDGTGQIKIPNTGGMYDDEHCAFSPDGARIVFSSTEGASPNYRLWVINTDGSNRTQLTNGAGTYDDQWPDWK